VRDEEEDIDRLVAHIGAQTLAPAAVLFVDGGSQDRTVDKLRESCAVHPTWRLIEDGDATPGRGRNVGIEAAQTEWVARTDAVRDPSANAPEAVARWRPPATAGQTFRRFRTYSRVNVLAGQQRHWHYGVARMYLVASPFAVLALRHRRWAAIPVAGLVLRSVV